MQLSDGYFSGTPLSVSDSIVAVVRATNTGNQSHIITLVTEGSQHYSYAVSTIPTQQGLTCDTLSGCSIIQTIQTDISNKFDKSGGTVTGDTIFTSGLTATTISGGTYVGDGSQLSIANSSTGTTITFTAGTIYNSPTSAATGNISADTTNSKIGIVQKIYHNDSVSPTFNPSGWVKLGIGSYTTSTLNIIYAEWVSGSRIEYWITQ
jgi:hypothetical protein